MSNGLGMAKHRTMGTSPNEKHFTGKKAGKRTNRVGKASPKKRDV